MGWKNIIDSTALCPGSAAKNTQLQQHDLYFIHFRKLCDIVQSSMGTHTLSHSHSLTHTRKSSSRTGWLDFCLQTLCIESQFRVESNLNWSGDKTMSFIRGTVVASWRSDPKMKLSILLCDILPQTAKASARHNSNNENRKQTRTNQLTVIREYGKRRWERCDGGFRKHYYAFIAFQTQTGRHSDKKQIRTQPNCYSRARTNHFLCLHSFRVNWLYPLPPFFLVSLKLRSKKYPNERELFDYSFIEMD